MSMKYLALRQRQSANSLTDMRKFAILRLFLTRETAQQMQTSSAIRQLSLVILVIVLLIIIGL